MGQAGLSRIDTYRTGSKVHMIAVAVLEELDADPEQRATTSRLLYYRLISRGVIRKEDKRGSTTVSEQITRLRRLGLIPYWRIVDRTRASIEPLRWESIAEAVQAAIDKARLDPWINEVGRPLLIVESESLAGLLEPIAYTYGVPIFPTRGQASESFLWALARDWLSVELRYVFYLGDADKAGADIETNVRERLETFAPPCKLYWERIAVTDDQIEEYDLTVIQKRDKRTNTYFDAVETEALGQSLIFDLVDTALSGRRDSAIRFGWHREDVEAEEESEREGLWRRLKKLETAGLLGEEE